MNDLRLKQYDLVKWAQKGSNDVSKKIQLDAVNYDGELVCQTTEPGQEKIKFVDVCKVAIDQKDFFTLSHALFARAALEINRKAFKAREAGKDTVLCDLAYTGKDFHILRVRSYMKFNENGQATRVTKIMIHKLNSWDDIKEANRKAMELKNGSLGYSKDTCVFEFIFNPYPVIQNNWADSEDILELTKISKKLEAMYVKPSSYGTFLDRVYNLNNDGNSSETSKISSGSETVGRTVTIDDDDEMPF